MKKSNIKIMLKQLWGPISINYQITSHTSITVSLFEFHIENLDRVDDYNISELYSLYKLIEFIMIELREDEFSTVTWLDFYKDWYWTLDDILKKIRSL